MNKFQQWVCSSAFHDLAAQLSSGNDPDAFGDHFERLKEGVIAAEQHCREAAGETVAGAMPGLSRYTPAIVKFQQATGGDVYCFVVNGNLGTGGMPLIHGFPPRNEYHARCQALIALLRRSAELLERDIGGGSVG
jgi:hypothetical protein